MSLLAPDCSPQLLQKVALYVCASEIIHIAPMYWTSSALADRSVVDLTELDNNYNNSIQTDKMEKAKKQLPAAN